MGAPEPPLSARARRAAAVLAILLAGCVAEGPRENGVEVYRRYDRPATLPRDPAAVEVKVSTSRQRVYVMEDDRPLLVMPVSLGAPDSPTPHGEFRILRKRERMRSRVQGFARSGERVERTPIDEKPAGWSFTGMPLPYWCEFHDGLAFHTGWIKHRPTTDGSIRMHENLAPKFYRLVRVGTPVRIARWLPEDATLGNIPLPPDAGPLVDEPDDFYLGDDYFTHHLPPSFEPRR